VEAIRLGAADYLLKPVDPEELLSALDPSTPRHSSKEKPDLPTLERAQWEYIHRVLSQCEGNISEAARRLGLHRQSLQRMLRRNPPRK
jgi:two-component system response regulator RegA